jgi:hypothetical protein
VEVPRVVRVGRVVAADVELVVGVADERGEHGVGERLVHRPCVDPLLRKYLAVFRE